MAWCCARGLSWYCTSAGTPWILDRTLWPGLNCSLSGSSIIVFAITTGCRWRSRDWCGFLQQNSWHPPPRLRHSWYSPCRLRLSWPCPLAFHDRWLTIWIAIARCWSSCAPLWSVSICLGYLWSGWTNQQPTCSNFSSFYCLASLALSEHFLSTDSHHRLTNCQIERASSIKFTVSHLSAFCWPCFVAKGTATPLHSVPSPPRNFYTFSTVCSLAWKC